MQQDRPKFIDSEWFVMEVDNWHLKDGAPPEIVEEFNEYMKTQENMYAGHLT